jgi:hypothetical protein
MVKAIAISGVSSIVCGLAEAFDTAAALCMGVKIGG